MLHFYMSLFCSMGIESVVDESMGKSSDILHDAMCSACEMTVVWMQNQLKQNQTQERILDYVNQVLFVLMLNSTSKGKAKLIGQHQ